MMMVCPPPATTRSTKTPRSAATRWGRQALKSESKEQVVVNLVTGGQGST